MRYVVLDGDQVANVTIADESFGTEQGWIASDTAQIGWLFDGEAFAEPPPAPILVDQVIAECERRLALGFDYDFGDERGVHHIGTSPADMIGWDEVTKGANAVIALGQGDAVIQIVTETGPAAVTALEWQAILLAATAVRQPIWQASFALQAMDLIPSDFADDAHWTA